MSSYSIFLILIVIVAFLLVVVIMVQNPKGGGLSSSFGGGGTQQLGGVKQTTDFLDKSTWVLGGTLIGLILLSNITFTQSDTISESKALNSEEIVVDNIGVTWYQNYKWKPPEENTIDFLVSIKKDPDNEQNDLTLPHAGCFITGSKCFYGDFVGGDFEGGGSYEADEIFEEGRRKRLCCDDLVP